MPNDDIKNRILQLRAEINKHNHNYYVLNSPTVTDQEFDAMLRDLQELEKAYPEFFDPLSPTQRVGSDISSAFKQVAHVRPMMSLSNSYSVDEVKDFLRRAKNGILDDNVQIVGEMKLDGTSISLTYQNRRLVRAVTRGDGIHGDDVTANVITIRSIPLEIPAECDCPDEFEVRGEILLPWKNFDELNQERAQQEEQLFANPRNAAAGTLKLQNSAEVARRGLDAYFYFLLGDNLPADNHYDCIQALKRWGFKVSDPIKILNSIDDVSEFIDYWDVERKHLPVATDGLVFKINSLQQQRTLGATAKSPRWAIAYKFAPERECTELLSVSFEVGRGGTITPVANLQPVLLSGTIVKRASLHNADIIQSLNIHEHDMVYVEKGGEIIPKIVGVDEKSRKADAKPIEFITTCPECGSPLTRAEGEAAWMCPNKLNCPPQIYGRLEHFVARRMMNIDGVGSEGAQLLFESGLVENIADIYDLTLDKLMMLDRFQQKSAQRIIDGIESSKKVPFERVLFALSIPYVGATTAKSLARAMKNIDAIMDADTATLESIDEVGTIIAQSVNEFFASDINREIVQRLKLAGVQLAINEENRTNTSTKLADKKIVISGVFAKHSRDEYKAMIEANGGKNVSSISKNTDFILAGENMGPSKLEKAQQLGVAIINEDEFLAMLEG